MIGICPPLPRSSQHEAAARWWQRGRRTATCTASTEARHTARRERTGCHSSGDPQQDVDDYTRERGRTVLPEHATRFCPGVQGGVEWNGPAYQPALGLLFVNAIDWCTSMTLQPAAELKGAVGAP